MTWFKSRNVPTVKVEDGHFTILPDEGEIIDVMPDRANLPAVRETSAMTHAPKVGTIPPHTWG